MKAAEISRSALDVEWRRLEVIADNLANANTSRTAMGEPYKAQRLISGPRVSFQKLMSEGGRADQLGGVEVYGVEPMNLQPREVYEPGNPQADAKGFVSYPGYDQAEQMTLLIKTERVYEANIVALNTAGQLYRQAMDIGRSA
jgi:flagellar basal-body rod protein FlgC